MKFTYQTMNVYVLCVMLSLSCCASLQGENRKLGSIDGTIVGEKQARIEGAAELEALELKMLQTRAAYTRTEHEILETALNRIIEEKLLQMEADKRGLSKEELLENEVMQNIQAPTEEDIAAFYEENKRRINMSMEDAASRIGEYLKQGQAVMARKELLTGLEKEHKVVRFLEPLRFEVDAPDRPFLGPSSAPVVLVEFSDFQCSYCKEFSNTLKSVIDHYGDKVRLVFRQYPILDMHPDAQRAAEASLCAAAQDRFWEMHDLLFENQMNLEEEGLLSMAEQLGLDSKAFQTCLASGQYSSMVREDMRAAAAAGTNGTPTLFINGKYFEGNYPYEEVAKLIDEELKAKEVSASE